ncbi:hypothetical protein KY347_00590 [Candidatus Woesearchaeota archaeon]|nr:hypothetical protein [Candidatus Woesearchaeota archaeon]
MPMEKLVAEKIHIRCRAIIEILGKPKEHVEKTLGGYIDKIKTDPELIALNAEFSNAEEKEKLWAAFAELEMVIKGIPKLIAFCFDYMPSSVEILKPEEFSMKKSLIEDMINDLQARLHNVDMAVKQQKNENEFLRKNLNTAVRNVILISLAAGSLGKEKLSKVTGIGDEELEIFLEKLAKENKITNENGVYSLKSG